MFAGYVAVVQAYATAPMTPLVSDTSHAMAAKVSFLGLSGSFGPKSLVIFPGCDYMNLWFWLTAFLERPGF